MKCLHDHRLEPPLKEVGARDDKVITGGEPCKTDMLRVSHCHGGSHYATRLTGGSISG